jgi:arylsulfatase A-like enzyme
VLLVLDDDHPPYMMDPMPTVRRRIRDAGLDLHEGATDIPLCGPARVSVLTGLSVTTHRCDTNEKTYGDFKASPLGLEDRTVARFLKDAGYVTAHFGKYVNGHGLPGAAPYWDFWRATRGGNSEDPGAVMGSVDGEWVSIPSQASMWAAARLAQFVRNRAGGERPWFAQYCPTIPHSPYTPTPDSRHLYDGADRDVPSTNERRMGDKPAWMRRLGKVERSKIGEVIEGKKEELADLDRRCMRPVLEALAESGQLRNTVVFFTSDNGYMAGEHRLKGKDHPYWESAEVPFFARGPGVASGARSPALVSHVDLTPTICELAGVSLALLEADGRSMVRGLSSGRFGPWRERMLTGGSKDVGPEGGNPGGSNDPSGRWWLLAEGDKRFILRENGAKELYRMNSDPFQNRSHDDEADPALIRRLTEAVEDMRRARGEERRRLEGAP